MFRNDGAQLKKEAVPKKKAKRQRKPDERAQRTQERLGGALVELILEKPINDITVQEVLDRASVGRSTFYLHFRDKNDLLLSQLETFLATMSTVLIVRKEQSHRVVPVTEMFEHIGPDNKIYRALADADRLNDFFDLAQTYFARGIERRLQDSGRVPRARQRELGAHASTLAGSLLSLLRWWIDRGAKETPQAMDELFHRMVWNGLQ
jgi:AcrR family transcriptional regulator